MINTSGDLRERKHARTLATLLVLRFVDRAVETDSLRRLLLQVPENVASEAVAVLHAKLARRDFCVLASGTRLAVAHE